DIHRVTGQESLFDTVFVYENYPTDAAALSSADGLTVTELTNRDYSHCPLAIQAVPGRELELHVQYRADVFDATAIDAMIARFQRVLVAMTVIPAQPLSSMHLSNGGKHRARVTQHATASKFHANGVDYPAPTTLVEQILAGICAGVLGVDRIGVNEAFLQLGGDSLSAMRAVAAINTALDTNLAVTTIFDAPSVRSLSEQLGRHADPSDDL